MPDILAAAEWTAKAVRNTAHRTAGLIAEIRSGFDDSEAGDYLTCAGADALEDTFGEWGDAPVYSAAASHAAADPAGGEATASIPLGATSLPGHSTSDLLTAAAKWFEYTSDRDLTGVITELAINMRDRAAQFAAHGD